MYRGVSSTKDWEKGYDSACKTLDDLGSVAFSLQPARVAPTGVTWTHPSVSSAPNIAQLRLKGPRSVPVRVGTTALLGRAPMLRAHVSRGQGLAVCEGVQDCG